MRIFSLIFLFLFAGNLFADDFTLALTKSDFYIDKKEYRRALKELNSIDLKILSDSKKAKIYNRRGFVYYKKKQYNEALKNYFISLKLDTNLYYVYNNIGVVYFALKDFEKAKEYYLEAVNRKSNYIKAFVNLALVNLYLRDYHSSYSWMMKAFKSDREYISKRFSNKKAVEKLKELAKERPDDKELKDILKWAEKVAEGKFSM